MSANKKAAKVSAAAKEKAAAVSAAAEGTQLTVAREDQAATVSAVLCVEETPYGSKSR